jgi:predicted homoserine dehydrogenase-like protein
MALQVISGKLFNRAGKTGRLIHPEILMPQRIRESLERERKSIGLIGSGFISKGLVMLIEQRNDLQVHRVLTRSRIDERHDFPRYDLLTNSPEDLLQGADLILEASGDVCNSTAVLEMAMERSIPVITMNAELQITTGSCLARKGFITEAEGDQPGCLAALREEVLQMGLSPLVYGNLKNFLNHNPTLEEMRFWAGKSGNSVENITSFTDGTKVQIEQALVANGLGAAIIEPGLCGLARDSVEAGGMELAEKAKAIGSPVSDYLLSAKIPPGVFVTAECDPCHKVYLRYYKMGVGPYYTFVRNYHLCHFEAMKTIDRVLSGGKVLINNSLRPRISVATVAKRDLVAGYLIKRGIGSFDVRGVAVNVKDCPDHVPIGLLQNARVARDILAGEMIAFDQVGIPEGKALRCWEKSVGI